MEDYYGYLLEDGVCDFLFDYVPKYYYVLISGPSMWTESLEAMGFTEACLELCDLARYNRGLDSCAGGEMEVCEDDASYVYDSSVSVTPCKDIIKFPGAHDMIGALMDPDGYPGERCDIFWEYYKQLGATEVCVELCSEARKKRGLSHCGAVGELIGADEGVLASGCECSHPAYPYPGLTSDGVLLCWDTGRPNGVGEYTEMAAYSGS